MTRNEAQSRPGSDDRARGDSGGASRPSRGILATENRVLELIASGRPLPEVLHALVEAIEIRCEGAIGSVLVIAEDGRHLCHGAAPGLPDAYNQAVDGIEIGPAVGSCGTAAYRGERVVVTDTATDPLWADFRELVEQFGLRACWSQPIFSTQRKVLGTFAMYHREPHEPTPADLEYIEAASHLAGIALERAVTDRKRRAADQRLLRQKAALVELAKSEELASAEMTRFLRLATEAAADTLAVERVSIWFFGDERTALRCRDLYQRSTGQHSDGTELRAAAYPAYFAALERGRSVVAHDARVDPDTCEFTEGYLEPLGITSMLDAPIRRAGEVVGVVCHEHVGSARVWAADEQEFSASVADFISLSLEATDRRRAEQAYRSAQEELLRQQWQANKQFEFELEKVREKLVLSTRLATAGQIAASIAHELRNPLAALQNAIYYVKRHAPAGDAKWAEYLAIMEHEIRVADATVENLLEMSRSREPTLESVELGASIEAAFRYVEPHGTDLRLEVDLTPEPFVVEADPDQLRQVLANLMTNSAHAMEGSGRIVVRARRRAGWDEIAVEDDGPGVPSRIQSKIFEPLFTTKSKGTGLGLAICRQILDRHGGRIELLRSDNRGATVLVRLPSRGGATTEESKS